LGIRSRRILLFATGATVGLVALNAQPVALAGIHAYQHALSPLAARAGLRCRFEPTCSRYAQVVIERDGALRGGWKSIKRVARCNPLTPVGTRDEP
jgi:putative membrane protein insertion efficiency factor